MCRLKSLRGSRCLLLYLTFTLGCVPTTSPESDEEHIKAIVAVSEARAEAFNNSDADGIARHFTEDALLMPPGRPVMRGRASVKSYYQAIVDAYRPELTSRYEEVRVSGGLAYGRGTAHVKLTPIQGGEPLVSTSTYLNILELQPDGTWKTTHDIWNSVEKDE